MERVLAGDAALARALDDHFREQVVAYGHLAPRGEVHVTDHAVLAHCGRPSVFNRATALDWDQPDVALSEVEGFFGDLPHALWLREGHVDDDVQALLEGRGYAALTAVPGVARELPATDLVRIDDHRTTLLADPSRAAAVAEVATSGYGFGVDDRIVIEDVVRNVLRHARPFDHGAVYAVEHGGELAAIGMLLCTADLAGVSTIVTEARHRRNGLATAIVTRALNDAAALGYRAAGFVANPDSRALFADLGFRAVTRYRVYRQVDRA